MIPSVVVRTTQKDGNDADENEDRGAFDLRGPTLRVAVADGATESSFSDLWADALVSVAIEGAWAGRLAPAGLDDALARYRTSLPAIDKLPWYAQAKLAEGSHAALAVTELRPGRAAHRWRASVVGDCEVFVLKPGRPMRLIRAFPATSASEFGFHPTLIPTDASRWSSLPVVHASGRLHPPYELWLTTDALGESCLAAHEAGRSPWEEWAVASESQDAFEALVARKRGEHALRNDDVTMVRAWLP